MLARMLPAAALSLALLAPHAAGAADTAAAQALVSTTLDSVLAVLRDKAMPPAQRRAKVESIAYVNFDFETISKLVLARNWPKLSEQKKAEFITEFKRHLAATYWKTLEDYRNEKVVVEGSRAEKNGDVTVRSTVKSERSEPLRIDYRLRDRGGAWKVIDVIIENVSLVQNFRSQTQELIAKVGIEGLLEELRKKNTAREKEWQ